MCLQYMELRSLSRHSRNQMISHMAENAVFLDQRNPCQTAECRAQSPARTLMIGTAINFRKNTAEYNLDRTAEAHEKTFPLQIHDVTKQKPAIRPRTEQETSKGCYWFLWSTENMERSKCMFASVRRCTECWRRHCYTTEKYHGSWRNMVLW